ncbi:MAG: hypothetical protein HS111_33560 [Kofleriaceae bacterium]|nr:hypothetical protein [Kofleriaceae bacterium]MCL4227666.1 hypothetical protein [Myxococcales bacterium]
MKRSHLVALAAVTLAPAAAAAQPGYGAPPPPPPPQGYYSQPPTIPGGFHDRTGRMALGFSLGLGGLNVGGEEVTCPSCDYDPLAVEFDFHIGGMLSPRFALLFEVQANGQTIAENAYGAASLVQATAMVAGQYWLTPQLWVKGGIGAASLSYSYDDGYASDSENIGEGMAVMGAIGYEVLSAPTFSIDLQGRIISGSYDSFDENVTAGSIGVGFNWY